MTPLFADTYYYLALVNPKDQGHEKAMQFARTTTRHLIITDWIITELADALCSVANRPLFFEIFASLNEGKDTTIVHASQPHWERGLALYAARPDKDWPLTDCRLPIASRS